MKVETLAQFIAITIVLTIGLSGVIGAAYRVNVAANWEEQRCDSYVIPIAGFFKPTTDPRTAAQFATDNWTFCQKEYIQNALRVAAEVPKELAASSAGSVGIVQDIASTVADVFFNLWTFCYETYSSFMDQMKVMAKLFHNFMINLYSIAQRLNASILSIIYGLIALIISIIDSIKVTIMVVLIILGIITGMMILLFFALIPIMPLYITVTTLVVAAVATMGIMMATEGFGPGACFASGTPVQVSGGSNTAIQDIRLGTLLRDGGRVTAIHQFRSSDSLYNVGGIHVTGDHLIAHPDYPNRRIYVRDHPEAQLLGESLWSRGTKDLWCLTTTTRRIPCDGPDGVLLFADWEEIEEHDTYKQDLWFRGVWNTLNGSNAPPRKPSASVLESEAGLSPDCLIPCMNWLGQRVVIPLRAVRIGDRIFDSPTTTTIVVGKVTLEGDQTTNAVELPGSEGGVQFVSCATWIFQGSVWKPVVGPVHDVHPIVWEHLYTESGQFMLDGGHRVRDASDVGLSGLRHLVDSVVLPDGP